MAQLDIFARDPVLDHMLRLADDRGLSVMTHDGMTVLYKGDRSIGVERLKDDLYVIWARGYGTYPRNTEYAIIALEEMQW